MSIREQALSLSLFSLLLPSSSTAVPMEQTFLLGERRRMLTVGWRTSGQAARWMAIAGLAAASDNIVSASTISEEAYTQFRYRFPSQGISVKFIDVEDADVLRNAIDDRTKAVYVESLSPPHPVIASIHILTLCRDNTPGAGGYLCRPIDHGADIVIHSASERLGGLGHAIAGAIVDSGKFPWNVHARRFLHLTEPAPGYHGMKFWEKFGDKAYIFYVRSALLRDAGPCLNPFAAFSLLAGMETLSVRMDRHSGNALALARWLEGHEKVAWVVYPGLPSHPSFERAKRYLRNGFGGLLFFRLAAGDEASQAAMRKFKLVRNADGIGTTQTLVHYHRVATGSYVQESPSQQSDHNTAAMRVSVGLEHIDDIIEDFRQALACV
ncbi:O-acetylhomoserine (Thiol)-lyase [Rasamsonia emersonii CBS 393.64]|uniref:O-acetylhomoserine (Thiol)-lyase n=1 Tax=Rasamsonia emersonii (strain ATCC 16479 / CBS 393.64 / IMI 116815) TaxID=1408163 RepID=A0A0F4Z5W8_RASE3|nr:O-acetylhomoserine (Thiol)-lyase [Rasamsonia emersonii CBS 393.64]KKA25496.1 O-acetylhomoserine (Thiol)-lyase [Rasamsonia emersonii CBS 393.64]